ncbi:MAG TPA: hypothetical protein VNI01_11590, partial [Elusimicrobiota bacterium]|nr:hypothetical protein [Elusimicrobiota bacterium]
NGAVAAVSTPFDDRLAALSRDLDGSMVAYGARRAKAAAEIKSYALMAKMAPASAAADRASFRAVAGSFGGASDLVEAVASNSVDLKAMKDEELPENMRGLSAEKRAQAVAEAAAKREKIRAEIGALSMQRSRYLREHAKTRGDSFDAALVDSLKVEAARKGIAY